MTAFLANVRGRPDGALLRIGALSASAACGAAAWWGVEHDPKIALIIAMAIVASLPFVIRALQRRWDPFEPINIVALGVLYMCVARPIMEINEHLQPYASLYNAPAGFGSAMVVCIVGTAALYGGYYSRLGARVARRIRSLPSRWDAPRSVRYSVGVLVVGALLTSMFVAQVGLHNYIHIYSGRTNGQVATFRSSNGYFELGIYVTIPCSFVLLTAWRTRRTPGTAFLLLLCIAIGLGLTVFRGDRTFTLALLFPFIVMFYLHRRRRPHVLTIVLGLVIFAIAANVSAYLRHTETRAQRGVTQSIVNAVTHPGQELSAFVRGADGSEFSVLEIEMHQYELGALPHWPGSTISGLVTGWIPHQILKQKPLSPLQHVTWTLFPASRGGGSFGPPMYGSFYADSGWLSLLVISIVVGVAIRALWEYFLSHREVAGAQLFFAASLPLVAILLRGDLSAVLAGAVFLTLPLVLCIVRCSRPPLKLGIRRQTRPTALQA